MACYHKEWAYFSHRYKVTCVEYIEAKPGIPPTPGHVQEVIALMRQRKIPVLFASNYFDRNQIRQVAERTGAQAVIVPENTGGAPGMNTYFDLINTWVSGLAAAFRRRSVLMDLSLFLPPLVACLVIVAIHSYLGLHVIAREVIFVDLSLAQMAALGSAVAILAGSQPDSHAAFLYALGFTTLGAALFALTRTEERGAGAAGGDHRHRVRGRLRGRDPGGRPDAARR